MARSLNGLHLEDQEPSTVPIPYPSGEANPAPPITVQLCRSRGTRDQVQGDYWSVWVDGVEHHIAQDHQEIKLPCDYLAPAPAPQIGNGNTATDPEADVSWNLWDSTALTTVHKILAPREGNEGVKTFVVRDDGLENLSDEFDHSAPAVKRVCDFLKSYGDSGEQEAVGPDALSGFTSQTAPHGAPRPLVVGVTVSEDALAPARVLLRARVRITATQFGDAVPEDEDDYPLPMLLEHELVPSRSRSAAMSAVSLPHPFAAESHAAIAFVDYSQYDQNAQKLEHDFSVKTSVARDAIYKTATRTNLASYGGATPSEDSVSVRYIGGTSDGHSTAAVLTAALECLTDVFQGMINRAGSVTQEIVHLLAAAEFGNLLPIRGRAARAWWHYLRQQVDAAIERGVHKRRKEAHTLFLAFCFSKQFKAISPVRARRFPKTQFVAHVAAVDANLKRKESPLGGAWRADVPGARALVLPVYDALLGQHTNTTRVEVDYVLECGDSAGNMQTICTLQANSPGAARVAHAAQSGLWKDVQALVAARNAFLAVVENFRATFGEVPQNVLELGPGTEECKVFMAGFQSNTVALCEDIVNAIRLDAHRRCTTDDPKPSQQERGASHNDPRIVAVSRTIAARLSREQMMAPDVSGRFVSNSAGSAAIPLEYMRALYEQGGPTVLEAIASGALYLKHAVPDWWSGSSGWLATAAWEQIFGVESAEKRKTATSFKEQARLVKGSFYMAHPSKVRHVMQKMHAREFQTLAAVVNRIFSDFVSKADTQPWTAQQIQRVAFLYAGAGASASAPQSPNLNRAAPNGEAFAALLPLGILKTIYEAVERRGLGAPYQHAVERVVGAAPPGAVGSVGPMGSIEAIMDATASAALSDLQQRVRGTDAARGRGVTPGDRLLASADLTVSRASMRAADLLVAALGTKLQEQDRAKSPLDPFWVGVPGADVAFFGLRHLAGLALDDAQTPDPELVEAFAAAWKRGAQAMLKAPPATPSLDAVVREAEDRFLRVRWMLAEALGTLEPLAPLEPLEPLLRHVVQSAPVSIAAVQGGYRPARLRAGKPPQDAAGALGANWIRGLLAREAHIHVGNEALAKQLVASCASRRMDAEPMRATTVRVGQRDRQDILDRLSGLSLTPEAGEGSHCHYYCPIGVSMLRAPPRTDSIGAGAQSLRVVSPHGLLRAVDVVEAALRSPRGDPETVAVLVVGATSAECAGLSWHPFVVRTHLSNTQQRTLVHLDRRPLKPSTAAAPAAAPAAATAATARSPALLTGSYSEAAFAISLEEDGEHGSGYSDEREHSNAYRSLLFNADRFAAGLVIALAGMSGRGDADLRDGMYVDAEASAPLEVAALVLAVALVSAEVSETALPAIRLLSREQAGAVQQQQNALAPVASLRRLAARLVELETKEWVPAVLLTELSFVLAAPAARNSR